MVHHLVMWKVAESHQGKNKTELIAELQSRLLKLKDEIKEIVVLEIGVNGVNFDRNHDIVLVSQFNSFADLEVYALHPAHLKVVEFVRQVTTSRSAVDYEI